jgi:hypothetical protein
MSGSGRYIYAMYVHAGLCPKGCGDTLRPATYDGEPITRCEDCDWLGLSRASAEETLGQKAQALLQASDV